MRKTLCFGILLLLLARVADAQTNSYIQLPPDSTGKKVQTFTNTVGGSVVHVQGWTLLSPSGVAISATNPLFVEFTDGATAYTGTKAAQLPTALDGSGYLKVHEQGTANVSVQNSSIPVTESGTWNVNDQHSNITLDYDTGAGTQTMTLFGIALPASGGAVAGGTSSNPFRFDPTGTTPQPVTQSGSWSLAANQSVNVGQVNGVTPLMGNGPTGTGSPRVTVASDNTPFPVKTDQTTHGTTDLVAADVTKVAGTALDVNSGNKSAGTLRIVLATDQPSLTNKLLVTPDANSSVNIGQVGGSAVATGATGLQKVAITGAAGTTLDGATAGVVDVNVKNWNNAATLNTASVGSNVVAFTAKRAGTTLLAPNYYAARITSKTTTTPTAATAYISSITICVSGAGTSWSVSVQNKEGTPKIYYTVSSVALGTTTFNFTEPILATSGIDIVTAGTTAGTMDVFITYWQ